MRVKLMLVAMAIMALSQVSLVSLFAAELDVWFGTSRNNTGQPGGIYRATFDTEKGVLSKATLALKIDNAGWITWHPSQSVLYSSGRVNGQHVVCSIQVGEDKSLTLAQSISLKSSATHLTTDLSGSLLIAAQYRGGSVVSLPIKEDGMLGTEVQRFQHEGGSKVVKGRQNSPHPHYAQVSPDNQLVYVPDLGLDQLVVYGIDSAAQKLTALDQPIECVKGGGPRHMKILNREGGSDSPFVFVLNELSLSVSCFELLNDGGMKLLHTTETLSAEQKAGESFNSASEIRIHPSGKFIYTGNRGHDSISVFEFDAESSKLTKTQTAAIHGSWPRNFNLTPDGKYLLAAGARTNSVSVFSIDQESGKLTFIKKPIFVPGAICVSIR